VGDSAVEEAAPEVVRWGGDVQWGEAGCQIRWTEGKIETSVLLREDDQSRMEVSQFECYNYRLHNGYDF